MGGLTYLFELNLGCCDSRFFVFDTPSFDLHLSLHFGQSLSQITDFFLQLFELPTFAHLRIPLLRHTRHLLFRVRNILERLFLICR